MFEVAGFVEVAQVRGLGFVVWGTSTIQGLVPCVHRKAYCANGETSIVNIETNIDISETRVHPSHLVVRAGLGAEGVFEVAGLVEVADHPQRCPIPAHLSHIINSLISFEKSTPPRNC